MKTFRMAESINVVLAILHHLPIVWVSRSCFGKWKTYLRCHIENFRTRSVVNHGIGKHQVNVSLKFRGVGYYPLLDACLDRLEVHWTLDDVVVVGCFMLLDRIMENVAISMLGYGTVKHVDDILELFVCGTLSFPPAPSSGGT